jgi:hypothetical protein
MKVLAKSVIPLFLAATLAACSSPQTPVSYSAPAPSEPDVTTRSDTTQASTPVSFNQAFYDASAQRNAKEIAELTQAFINLGPGVDPSEAARAARVVYTYVDQLVIEYQITDPPLVHNSKVNFGIKPRGLCWHWAHDIDDRLQLERFRTLEIHRAIANYNNLRLEHSTTILGRRGDPMAKAIVLDPWRNGGEVFWEIVEKDTRYNWTPRDEVFAFKRARKQSQDGASERRAGRERF